MLIIPGTMLDRLWYFRLSILLHLFGRFGQGKLVRTGKVANNVKKAVKMYAGCSELSLCLGAVGPVSIKARIISRRKV